MIRIFLCTLFIFFFIVICAQDKTINIYVSNKVATNGDGSIKSPFNDLIHAKNFVKTIAQEKGLDIHVILRQGNYFINEPIKFSPHDGAVDGSKITYEGYTGEKVTISGGEIITNWEIHKGNIYKTKVDGTFRQLYVNGKPTTRSRYPNEQYNRIMFYDLNEGCIGIPASDKILPEDLSGVEMIVQTQWCSSILRIKNIESIGNSSSNPANYVKIYFQSPESEVFFSRLNPPKKTNAAYHFENSYAFLDQPGEWYHDADSGVLYYWPKMDENLKEDICIVPRIENIVIIEGNAERPVKNIGFKNLSFEHSNWVFPTLNGYVGIQAAHYDHNGKTLDMEGAIKAQYAEHLLFQDNSFRSLGSSGISFRKGVKQCKIVNNLFFNIAANGMQIGEFYENMDIYKQPYGDLNKNLVCENIHISNNNVTHIGLSYPGAIGIAASFVKNVEIVHNEVAYAPYSGISVGWGWYHDESVMSGNKINHNKIHHVVQLLCDGGGIYTLSYQPESEIIGNYIYAIEKSVWAQLPITRGIYLDEGSGGFIIGNNAIERPPIEAIGFHHVKNNKIIDCCQSYNESIKRNAGIKNF